MPSSNLFRHSMNKKYIPGFSCIISPHTLNTHLSNISLAVFRILTKHIDPDRCYTSLMILSRKFYRFNKKFSLAPAVPLLVTDSKNHLISVSNQALNLNPDSLISHSALIYAEKHIGKDSSLFSVMSFLAFLLINGFGGAFFASRILDPVRKMSDAMNRVTENNLSARLDILAENDELGTLAATFNHTLDRIEKAYRSQGQLVSDLSHQLRTPLTSIRGAVELGMQKARSIGDYQAILENASPISIAPRPWLIPC